MCGEQFWIDCFEGLHILIAAVAYVGKYMNKQITCINQYYTNMYIFKIKNIFK